MTDIFFSKINKLRSKGLVCEFYPLKVRINKQLNYANKKDISYVVFLGENEIENKKFTLKNMTSGEQEQHPIDNMLRVLEKLNKI